MRRCQPWFLSSTLYSRLTRKEARAEMELLRKASIVHCADRSLHSRGNRVAPEDSHSPRGRVGEQR